MAKVLDTMRSSQVIRPRNILVLFCYQSGHRGSCVNNDSGIVRRIRKLLLVMTGDTCKVVINACAQAVERGSSACI